MSERTQMVATMACLKTLLMVFNIFFWVSGVALMALAAWMQLSLRQFLDFSAEFSSVAPWLMLLGCGGLIVIISSLACCCTVKGQPTMLYCYGVFLALVLVLEILLGSYLYMYRDNLPEEFEKGMNQTMMEYDMHGAEMMSHNFDSMQITLKCCGINGYEDWAETSFGHVPPSCCIRPRKCDVTNPVDLFSKGCYATVVGYLDANINLIAGMALGIACFPLVGVILACCLAKNINRAKYEPMT